MVRVLKYSVYCKIFPSYTQIFIMHCTGWAPDTHHLELSGLKLISLAMKMLRIIVLHSSEPMQDLCRRSLARAFVDLE